MDCPCKTTEDPPCCRLLEQYPLVLLTPPTTALKELMFIVPWVWEDASTTRVVTPNEFVP
jgi:hypothetical protein